MLSLTRIERRKGALTRIHGTVGQLAFFGGLGAILIACSSGGARPGEPDAAMPVLDGGVPRDAALERQDAAVTDGGGDLATTGSDLATTEDLSVRDLAVPMDLARPADLTPPTDLVTTPDLAFPSAQNVSIYVDNTCRMDVIPKSISVPHGITLNLTFLNRSRDYAVDVWMSYGGGYTDLATGGTWVDPIPHCRTPLPHDEYADISTACSRYRMMIHCL